LSRDRQTFSIGYQIPRDTQPLHNYWGIDYGLKNEIEDSDTRSFLSTLNFQRVRRTESQWIEALFIRWERETFTVGGEEDRTDLVLPGFSYSRTRTKGEPFVTWGQSASFQLEGGSSRFLSSIDLLKVSASFKYLREVTDRNTLIAAFQYGALYSDDFDRVPTSQRFFTGGDNSIRGFRFRDVSPRNPEGNTVGGRFLEVASLEYNYRFRDRWSGALFIDAGRAFNSFDTAYSVGSGFGVRWQSPVGPFRIDIATPINGNDNDTGSVRVHLSLGAEL
jgi:translocation and assembly module TamA